jgi:two-component system, LuxR family, response regulator FixJ
LGAHPDTATQAEVANVYWFAIVVVFWFGMVEQTIFIVDDDDAVRRALSFALQAEGFRVESFGSARVFLDNDLPRRGCLITDVRMPGMDGLELQREVKARHLPLSVIVMTGHGDVPIAVQAMMAGAVDFLEKPFEHEILVASIRRALELNLTKSNFIEEARKARETVDLLTDREQSVLNILVRGQPNKIIAHELGISIRTVEVHRSNIMKKTRARSLSDLVRITIAVDRSPSAGPP